MKQSGFRTLVMTWLVLFTVLFADPVSAQTMKMTAATIPLPADDKAQPLKGLAYAGPNWKVEFTAIRLEPDPDKPADASSRLWTLTAHSDRPRPQRVNLMIHLLDPSGKPIASAKKVVVVKLAPEDQEFAVKMKAKPKVWEGAERVKIQVNFLIGF